MPNISSKFYVQEDTSNLQVFSWLYCMKVDLYLMVKEYFMCWPIIYSSMVISTIVMENKKTNIQTEKLDKFKNVLYGEENDK